MICDMCKSRVLLVTFYDSFSTNSKVIKNPFFFSADIFIQSCDLKKCGWKIDQRLCLSYDSPHFSHFSILDSKLVWLPIDSVTILMSKSNSLIVAQDISVLSLKSVSYVAFHSKRVEYNSHSQPTSN